MTKRKEFVRGPNAPYFEADDRKEIAKEVERIGAKGVLEFGPGASTELFLSLGLQVTTCEHLDKWLKHAEAKFGDKARVLKYEDEVPVTVEGLGDDETFDLGFVDSPQGFNPVRKVHNGYADCSRYNTLAFALERCRVVLLHDATRPLERATLMRVWAQGWGDIEFLPTRLGMARIISKNVKNKSGPNTQDAEKPRRSANGSKPRKRRVSTDKRPHRPDPSGVASEECVSSPD